MTYTDMLARRGEILKRNIGKLIVRENKDGLEGQDAYFLKQMIRELHQNEHELNASK